MVDAQHFRSIETYGEYIHIYNTYHVFQVLISLTLIDKKLSQTKLRIQGVNDTCYTCLNYLI